MSVVCPRCKLGKVPGRPKKGTSGGKTRVVETRKAIARTKLHKKRIVTRTVQRLRECLDCRGRWKTIEITIPGSYNGYGHNA